MLAWMTYSCFRSPVLPYANIFLWQNSNYQWHRLKRFTVLVLLGLSRHQLQSTKDPKREAYAQADNSRLWNWPGSWQWNVRCRQRPSAECLTVFQVEGIPTTRRSLDLCSRQHKESNESHCLVKLLLRQLLPLLNIHSGVGSGSRRKSHSCCSFLCRTFSFSFQPTWINHVPPCSLDIHMTGM